MSELWPEPVFSAVPPPKPRSWKSKTIDGALIVLLVIGGLVLWRWYVGRQDRDEKGRLERIEQDDHAALESARTAANKQDPLWRLVDFPKRRTPVSPELDAAALLQSAFDEFSLVQRNLRNFNRSLARTNNTFLSVQSLLGGKPDMVGTHYENAFPCNRELHGSLIDQLRFNEAVFEPIRRRAAQASRLKQGNFPGFSREFLKGGYLAHSLPRLLPAFTGMIFNLGGQHGIVPVPLYHQVVLDWSEKKSEAWNELRLIVDLAVLPDCPSPDNLHYLIQGCLPVFTMIEWMIGQGGASEAELSALQKRLEPLLRQRQPLKNSLLCFRALADHYADLYALGTREIKTDFGENSIAMRHNVHQGIIECIRFTTEAIEKLDQPLADFSSWYDRKNATYPSEANFHEELSAMTPIRFFRVIFLANLRIVVQQDYFHQECLRIALVALACERYRLIHQRFPETSEQLHEFMAEDVWNDLFAKQSPIQIRLHPTQFGMVVIEDGSLPPDQSDWESKVSMNEPGYSVRLGFRLYRPELRGKPAFPIARESALDRPER